MEEFFHSSDEYRRYANIYPMTIPYGFGPSALYLLTFYPYLISV
jgi:hypothetical protein